MQLVNIEPLPKDKEFSRFCNTLRCPLCKSQLDGNIHPKLANLYCSLNNDEYHVLWVPAKPEPIEEKIKYYYPQYMYEIHYSNTSGTKVLRYNMDVVPQYRNTTRKEIFKCSIRLSFFRTRMEEDIFLNKLKLYNVFS